MKRLLDFLTVNDIREIHLGIFDDAEKEYLRHGPHGVLRHDQVRQKIRNVKGKKVKRILKFVTEFDGGKPEAAPDAWAKYMAASAGTHVWPDANHRTGFVTFDLACARAFGFVLFMPRSESEEMVSRSKQIRDADFRERGQYYTLDELADSDHPYRRLFSSYVDELSVVPFRLKGGEQDG